MKVTETKAGNGSVMVTYKADTFADMMEFSQTHRDPGMASSREGSGGFYTARSFAEAVDTMRAGWEAPMDRIRSIRESVRERVGMMDVTDWSYDHSEVGAYLDLSTYLTGDPQCMLRALPSFSKRAERFVRILVNTSFSAGVPQADITTRGAAVLGLCDALNLCGYSTEVWAVVSLNGLERRGADHLDVILPIQPVGTLWDTRSAAFPLANGDYFRRVVFGVMEGMSPDHRKRFGVPGGYGMPAPSTAGCNADLAVGGADIIIDNTAGLLAQIVRDPIAWVLGKCGNLGVLGDAMV